MRIALMLLGGCYVGVGGRGGAVVHGTSQPATAARGEPLAPGLSPNGVDFAVGVAVQPKPTNLIAAGVIVQSAAGEPAGGFMLHGEQAFGGFGQ